MLAKQPPSYDCSSLAFPNAEERVDIQTKKHVHPRAETPAASQEKVAIQSKRHVHPKAEKPAASQEAVRQCPGYQKVEQGREKDGLTWLAGLERESRWAVRMAPNSKYASHLMSFPPLLFELRRAERFGMAFAADLTAN